MLAPIVLFVYNRPRHTEQTLNALIQNEFAEQSILYVFADGPKPNEKDSVPENIILTRNIVKAKQWCRKVYVIEREVNLGVANNIIDGVSEIIQKHGEVIVLEDDIVTSPSFLKFMNKALDIYRDETGVACISAYIYPVKFLPQTFFLKGADCWGWATWKRSWDHFEKDGKKLMKRLEFKNSLHDFNFYDNYPYAEMLHDQITGKNDSWAILWYASCFLNEQFCLYPGQSFVKNIGLDGSGIHSVAVKNSPVQLNSGITISHQKVQEDKSSKRKIADYFKNNKPVSQKIFAKLKRIVLNR